MQHSFGESTQATENGHFQGLSKTEADRSDSPATFITDTKLPSSVPVTLMHTESNPASLYKASAYRSSQAHIAKRQSKKIVRHRRKRATDAENSDDDVYTSLTSTIDGSVLDDQDHFDENYDFDDDGDLGYSYERSTPEERESISKTVYFNACRQLGVVPSSYFCKHLSSTEIIMKNHVLGLHGTKACAIALVNNATVRKVDLEGNDVGNDGAVCIADMLLENVIITDLNLSENNLGRKGAQVMADVLKKNDFIRKLDLSGNGFDEDDAHYFADMLKENKTLNELILSHNRFRERGGEILSAAIAVNDTLEQLDLSWNHLRRGGAIAVSEGIQRNKGLLSVNLAWNGFHEPGCRALAKALTLNTTLLDLDLTCNRIDTDCLALLLRGLQKNESLQVLRIGHNPIRTEGALIILKLLEKYDNINVSELDLSGQCVDVEFLNELSKVRGKRLLVVKYGTVLKQDDYSSTQDKDEFVNDDPMMVLMEFMRLRNLRLVDLFSSLDKDGSQSLSREEFRNGLMGVNIPLSSKSLDRLINKLDADGDGEVDFSELINGQKEHKKKLHKLSMQTKDIPMEETELGRVTAKLQRLLAARPPPPSIRKNKGSSLVAVAGVAGKVAALRQAGTEAKPKKPAGGPSTNQPKAKLDKKRM